MSKFYLPKLKDALDDCESTPLPYFSYDCSNEKPIGKTVGYDNGYPIVRINSEGIAFYDHIMTSDAIASVGDFSAVDIQLTQNYNPHKTVTNCNNCGAVLHNNKCEYCGSEY